MTRSATSWFSRKEPDCQSIASTSVVFPWSTCATIATLRSPSTAVSSGCALPAGVIRGSGILLRRRVCARLLLGLLALATLPLRLLPLSLRGGLRIALLAHALLLGLRRLGPAFAVLVGRPGTWIPDAANAVPCPSLAASLLTSPRCSGRTRVTPVPVRPARPVRPTRWT